MCSMLPLLDESGVPWAPLVPSERISGYHFIVEILNEAFLSDAYAPHAAEKGMFDHANYANRVVCSG
jgi:hypothetical protein